jgi:hypothetical protein
MRMNLKVLFACIGSVVLLTSCTSSTQTAGKDDFVKSPMHLNSSQFINQSFTLVSRDTYLHYFFWDGGWVDCETGDKGGADIALAYFWCITNGNTLVVFSDPMMITNGNEVIITNWPNPNSAEIPQTYQFRSITPSLAVTMEGATFRRP